MAKLDLERDVVTLNGRALKIVTRTIDGGIIFQAGKSGRMVLTDDEGKLDGRDYAISRKDWEGRRRLSRPQAPELTSGQTVYCFKFSRTASSVFPAIYVGVPDRNRASCKVAPKGSTHSKDVVRVLRRQVFPSLEDLQAWSDQLVQHCRHFSQT